MNKNGTITTNSILVVLAPPTYVLSVFGLKLAHMHEYGIVGEILLPNNAKV
jgi:hypothetical protein